MMADVLDGTTELLRRIQRDLGDLRELTQGNSESVRRLDRRLSELSQDLEVMFKGEFLGIRAHLETSMDNKFDALDTKLDEILKRITG